MDSVILDWAKVIVAAVGGGFVVKVLDIAYLERRRREDRNTSATAFVDNHLDPLLKAADELVGKLLSLGQENFRGFASLPENRFSDPDFGSTSYLIASFWAQIEILRQQALYVSISQDARGRQLQSFLRTLEARRIRLLDRISQRAAGETLIASSGTSATRYIDFIKSMDDPDSARWLEPLRDVLERAIHTASRQQLLQYVVVLHAMIDTLDPDRSVTRNRPGLIADKLSQRSWTNLRYRIFPVYLDFVEEPEKYFGRPKKLGGRSRGEARH